MSGFAKTSLVTLFSKSIGFGGLDWAIVIQIAKDGVMETSVKGELHFKVTLKGMKGNLKTSCTFISVFKKFPPAKRN